MAVKLDFPSSFRTFLKQEFNKFTSNNTFDARQLALFIQEGYPNTPPQRLLAGVEQILHKFGENNILYWEGLLNFYTISYEEKPKRVEGEFRKRGYEPEEDYAIRCLTVNGEAPCIDGTKWLTYRSDEINLKLDMDVILVFSDNVQEIHSLKNIFLPHCFVIVYSRKTIDDPLFRQDCTAAGVKMLTYSYVDVITVINQIVLHNEELGEYTCPYCVKPNLTEDNLWEHGPLYHIAVPKRLQYDWRCPICDELISDVPFQVHLRNHHGPCGRGELEPETKRVKQLAAFALVVCRRQDGKYLLVQESSSAGYWLPGGVLDPGEGLKRAAIRETLEEAGVNIQLKSILSFQFKPVNEDYCRLRVIFYAEPVEGDVPKSIPCYDSYGAVWVDPEDLTRLQLRGAEPLNWVSYLENGGAKYPLDLLSMEET